MKKIKLERFYKDSELLKALAHPIRLAIVKGLSVSENECNVNKIAESLKIPQSTVSQHLALLRNKGIISPRKEGVNVCYKVINLKTLELLRLLQL